MKFKRFATDRQRFRREPTQMEEESKEFDGFHLLSLRMPRLLDDLVEQSTELLKSPEGRVNYLRAMQRLVVFFPEMKAQVDNLVQVAANVLDSAHITPEQAALVTSLFPEKRDQAYQKVESGVNHGSFLDLTRSSEFFAILLIIFPEQKGSWRSDLLSFREKMDEEIEQIMEAWSSGDPINRLFAWQRAVDFLLICPAAKPKLKIFFRQEMGEGFYPNHPHGKADTLITDIFNAEVVLGNSTIFINDHGEFEYHRFSPSPAPPIPLPSRAHL